MLEFQELCRSPWRIRWMVTVRGHIWGCMGNLSWEYVFIQLRLDKSSISLTMQRYIKYFRKPNYWRIIFKKY